jgi:endoglucanase
VNITFDPIRGLLSTVDEPEMKIPYSVYSFERFSPFICCFSLVLAACAEDPAPAEGAAGGNAVTTAAGASGISTGHSSSSGMQASSGFGGSTPAGGKSGAGSGGKVADADKAASGGQAGSAGIRGSAGTSVTGTLPALHTEGPAIKDPSGKSIILRGVSLPDIGTLWAYNSKSPAGITGRIDKIIASGMTPRAIRLPVYPRTCANAGYQSFNSPAPFPVGTPGGSQTALTEDEYLSQLLKPAVDYVTDKGMYAIIDFHQIDNTDGQSAADATAFWRYLAGKFADYPNVIYEAFNEPVDTSTNWTTFKPRAQTWIDTIRAVAPENLIVISSMSWAQKPGDASDSPLTGTNLVYSAHIYPGNLTAAFRQQVEKAVTKVPVFITEWGYIQNGSDQNLGTADPNWGPDFRVWIDGIGASWIAWVTDNAWTPNMFTNQGMTALSEFGTLTQNWLSEKASSDWVQ